ncbi:YHYH protein, partial [archaeon]|nr:YHYH protein [archaeon]
YVADPKITISGGNGIGAAAKANFSKITHTVTFNAGSLYDQVNIATNTIGFTTYHKFRNYEKIIYNSQNQTKLGNLVDDSIYFVNIISPTEIKLHNTLDDAISGINTVSFGSYGEGLQRFSTADKKNVISSIEVINPGKGYTNKTLFFTGSSINKFDNYIQIPNHGYDDKEVILFDTDGSLPVGLHTNTEYYVKTISKDRFRVAKVEQVGIGSTLSSDINYINNRFIDLLDGGTGNHSIKYQPISLKIESPIGVTTFSGQDFTCKVVPIFTGSIVSVSLKSGGENYGDPNIVNYNRQPNITLSNGANAQISVIVSSQGKIIGAIVNNTGDGYNSPPLLQVLGSGSGAILTPVIVNEKIVDVKIIESGFGYNQVNTSIKIVSTGSNAQFQAKIKSWTINQIERLFQSDQINPDDGIITTPLASDRGLQYTHGYPARELRRKLLATSLDIFGNTIYRSDLENDNNTDKYHSPIIGWAYDGNPVYGPYGYKDKEGGAIVRLNSGYELKLKSYRPSTSIFPPGYFVEDYSFTNNGDLDEHNGRYCKTPEFPNGVYAYFSTFNNIKEATGSLNGYLRPIFPYVIGDTFNSKIIKYNFDQLSNLSFVDVYNSGWIRHTSSLGLLLNKTKYQGFIRPDNFTRGFTEVSSISPGQLDELQIISSGDNYSVLDNIFFNSQGTGGSGAYARISEIGGRDVTNIAYSFSKLSGVEFTPFGAAGKYVGFASTSHSLIDGDIISIQNLNILSTDFSKSYTVGVSTNNLTLSSDVLSPSQTGIVTYINVSGNLKFPVTSVNDVYRIGTEKVKIINIYPEDSRLRVYRSFDGSVGSAHSSGDNFVELSRKITFNSGFSTSVEYKLNREIYFDPRESAIIPSENLVLYSNPVPPSLVPTAWDYYASGIGTGKVEYYSGESPNGANDVAKVSFTSTIGLSDSFGLKYEPVSLSADYNTLSVFLKGVNGGEDVYMIIDDGLTYYSQLVTLTNEWKRYSFTAQTAAGAHKIRIGAFGPQGLTLSSTPSFYVWGAQIELGRLTSSFYSTSGSALTRASKKSGLLFFSNPGITQKKGIQTLVNTFYLPEHGFKTGDKIKYNVGHGYTGVSVSYGTTTTPLTNGQTLYVAAYDNNFIGVSTQRIGIGSTGGFVGIGSDILELFKINNYGTGESHSIKTDELFTIRGDVYKKTATVITNREHGLTSGDIVNLKITSGITTTVYIKYDDINRRILVNPRSFIDT